MTRSYPNASLFHRRLLLVAGAAILVFGVLSLQLFRLALVEGAARRAAAVEKLEHRTLLTTVRGTIYDRRGRPVAIDRASYDVAVHYDLISGAWAFDEAAASARGAAGRTRWNEMGPEERDAAIDAFLPQCEARAAALWGEIARRGGVAAEDLERRRNAILEQVQAMAAVVWDGQRQKWEAERERRARARFGTIDEDAVFTPSPIREQEQRHVVLAGVPDETAFDFQRLAEELRVAAAAGIDGTWRDPIEVRDSLRREYPWSTCSVPVDRSSLPRPIRSSDQVSVVVDGVADHIIGSMRSELWAEDVARRPFRAPARGAVDLGGYLPGDRVGDSGLEFVFEDELRGLRGEIIEWVDTGERERTEPVSGSDIRLTIDIALQARIQALLSPEVGLTVVQPWHQNHLPLRTHLNGAAVVLHVPSGQILAMVSVPTLAMGDRFDEAQRQRDRPEVFRPTEAVYPPGSIIKPLVLCAAVTAGVHDLSTAIECTGRYFPDVEDAGRCWIYRERYGFATHGSLLASEALGRSCNIFYYTIADRLGMPVLCEFLDRFGLGRPVGTPLRHQRVQLDTHKIAAETKWVGEAPGALPDDSDIARLEKAGQLRFATVIMGIGQGALTWTPLQAAAAYAMLARGGAPQHTTLVLEGPGAGVDQGAETGGPGLNLRPEVVSAALEGLRQSIEETYGTGHRIPYENGDGEEVINAPGVRVWGKTGTAQAPPWWSDLDGDGAVDEGEGARELDHSWFVGLVAAKGEARPQYALAVIVEYGGSGGKVSGPLANQIVRALQVEGYLPAPEGAAP